MTDNTTCVALVAPIGYVPFYHDNGDLAHFEPYFTHSLYEMCPNVDRYFYAVSYTAQYGRIPELLAEFFKGLDLPF
jgi:hypothetical protein